MTFDTIYRRNAWNGTETRSGPGSGLAATRRISGAILALVRELDVTTVLDAACGEGWWQPELPGYVGIDVSRLAIERAQQNHPDREYYVWDIRQSCPTADLVILRDAMQHLPLADGQAILRSVAESGARWLLASTYVGSVNSNVPAGGFFSPDLEAPPFNLPPALRLYRDGFDYADPNAIRDPRKMLGLWRMHEG